jgi:hypothetical protein
MKVGFGKSETRRKKRKILGRGGAGGWRAIIGGAILSLLRYTKIMLDNGYPIGYNRVL